MSDFTRQAFWYRLCLTLATIVYIVVIVSLQIVAMLRKDEVPHWRKKVFGTWYAAFFYLPAFNVIMIYDVGKFLLTSGVYPY